MITPYEEMSSFTTEASSGNVFADLGLPDAAELDTKVCLAVIISGLVAPFRAIALSFVA